MQIIEGLERIRRLAEEERCAAKTLATIDAVLETVELNREAREMTVGGEREIVAMLLRGEPAQKDAAIEGDLERLMARLTQRAAAAQEQRAAMAARSGTAGRSNKFSRGGR